MNNLSVKVKVLSVIITLSVLSLSIFAYLTFNSYMKDKLAFVYDYLATDTQSRSKLFSTSVGSYDLFLGSIISGLDFKTRHLPQQHLKFLQKNNRILGLYYHIPDKDDLQRVTMFESRENIEGVWSKIEVAPIGVSLIDPQKGTSVIKKVLSSNGSYAALTFKQVELVDILKSSQDNQYFFLNLKNFGKTNAKSMNVAGQTAVKKSIEKIPMPFGLLQMDIESERYFVSFARLGFQDIIFVNMMKERKIYKIQEILLSQVVLFLVLITSISLLIGTLAARWLTWNLDQLTRAASDMENEKFNTKIKVTSKDELGQLGLAFNSMGSKIVSLLNELRKYNTELEFMVQERTKELKNVTDIQKGMLNSLGQGFVLIDKNNKIHPVYSKVAEEMFDVIPSKADPAEILGIKEEEAQSFKDLYELVFSQALDFNDMVQLNPEFRTNSKHQHIAFNYAPIKNSESDNLEYILVIGTDKTVEMESMEKFKKEWNFSQMIMKMASNRFSVIKVVSEAFNMLSMARNSIESNKDFSLREVQRLVHTIKGSVSYFYIEDIKKLCHEYETYLTPFFDTKECPYDQKKIALDRIQEIENAFKVYIDEYDSIIQYKEASTNKSIAMADLNNFCRLLIQKDMELAKRFKAKFFRTKIDPFFQMYPSIISDLGIKLNKEAKLVIEGGQLDLPDGQWDELFGQFIHIVRNTMDHGFETPDVREAKGKPRTGTLKFKFEHDNKNLKVTISDDGQGLDWNKFAKKDPTVTCEEDAIDRIRTGGISSKDEVSDVSGRGVGVSSVFSTVERWGGTMEVINQIDKGITFIIVVPLINQKVKVLHDVKKLGVA